MTVVLSFSGVCVYVSVRGGVRSPWQRIGEGGGCVCVCLIGVTSFGVPFYVVRCC